MSILIRFDQFWNTYQSLSSLATFSLSKNLYCKCINYSSNYSFNIHIIFTLKQKWNKEALLGFTSWFSSLSKFQIPLVLLGLIRLKSYITCHCKLFPRDYFDYSNKKYGHSLGRKSPRLPLLLIMGTEI